MNRAQALARRTTQKLQGTEDLNSGVDMELAGPSNLGRY